MIRLEQVRGEMLERFERVDRRFAQNEQRLGRIEQRLADLGDRIEALRAELLAQLELQSWETSGVAGYDPVSDDVFEPTPESPDSTEQ
jgi:recombinational DNA repair ATPase RecF